MLSWVETWTDSEEDPVWVGWMQYSNFRQEYYILQNIFFDDISLGVYLYSWEESWTCDSRRIRNWYICT